MSSLDKQTMYYFRDEIEKTALIAPMAKGVWKMVSSAGRAAGKASADTAKGMNSFFTKRLASKTLKEGGEIGLGHQIGGALLTAGTIGTGVYGTRQAGKKFMENKNMLKQQGPISQAGIQQL